MKRFITNLALTWALILFAFFLGSGANVHLSEWDSDARIALTMILVMTMIALSIGSFLNPDK